MSRYLQFLVARALERPAAIRPPRPPRLAQPDGAPVEDAAPRGALASPRTVAPRGAAPRAETAWAETPWADAESNPAPTPPSAGSPTLAATATQEAADAVSNADPLASVAVQADRGRALPAQTPRIADRTAGRDEALAHPTLPASPLDPATEPAPVRVVASETPAAMVRLDARQVEREPARAEALVSSDTAPDTYIHIGRVELHAAPPAVTVRRADPRPTHQHMSLEEYLRRRDGRPR
jgi:hypothetical protein